MFYRDKFPDKCLEMLNAKKLVIRVLRLAVAVVRGRRPVPHGSPLGSLRKDDSMGKSFGIVHLTLPNFLGFLGSLYFVYDNFMIALSQIFESTCVCNVPFEYLRSAYGDVIERNLNGRHVVVFVGLLVNHSLQLQSSLELTFSLCRCLKGVKFRCGRL